MEKIAVWKPVDSQGIEYLNFDETENRLHVRSVVIRIENQSAFRLDYTIVCDRDYAVRTVQIIPAEQGNLVLWSDGQGHWFNAKQGSLLELDGCIDVDISATPFTNTLPIRRIQWQIGQSEVFRMVYILVPDLTVSVMRQRYTCLAKTDQGATFRYENVDDDFKADIIVDQDGLVVHYPGLFERIV